MLDLSLLVSYFIIQVNVDKSIIYCLFVFDVWWVLIVIGVMLDFFVLYDMIKVVDGVWIWKSELMKFNFYEYYFDVDGFCLVDIGSCYQKLQCQVNISLILVLGSIFDDWEVVYGDLCIFIYYLKVLNVECCFYVWMLLGYSGIGDLLLVFYFYYGFGDSGLLVIDQGWIL